MLQLGRSASSRGATGPDAGSGALSPNVHRNAEHDAVTHAPREELWARGLWVLAGVVLVLWAQRLWGYATVFPWLAVPVVGIGAWGLGTAAAGLLPPYVAPRWRRPLAWASLIVVVVAFGLWSYLQIFTAPGYGTDEIAFDQYAAQLFLHGVNPYLHSMGPAFGQFHVSPDGYTFQLNGTPVTALSYPALAFEFYLPVLALGWSSQAAIAVNVLAWMISGVVLFWKVPDKLRPLTLVLVSLSVYVSYAVGGVTDALFIPLLLGAAVAWDRFGRRPGLIGYASPVLFGLAMAVKQTPWIILPFLLAGIALERVSPEGWRRALAVSARYLAITTVAFVIPNIPFLVTSPGAWLHGILTPLMSSTVPAGQGIIALSLVLGWGGGSLTAYSVASLMILLSLLAAYALTYPRLKSWTFLLPSLALFFATRSFGSYLVTLLPIALLAAVTTGPGPARAWQHWRGARWTLAGLAVACFGLVAATLLIPGPLQMQINSVHTTGQLATVDQVTVSVTNRLGHSVQPAFTVDDGGAVSAFWLRRSGPASLAAHASATYTLVAPNFFAMPPVSGGFQVVAFTQTPGSVSTTGAYLASTWHVALVPDAVDHPVAANHVLVVKAEVLNRFDQPIRSAGIPVYLGQVVYAQRGLEYGQAQVNAGRPGQTPVSALTNAAGVATFSISEARGTQHPVYFEANLLNSQSYYPYGYSDILPIRFGVTP